MGTVHGGDFADIGLCYIEPGGKDGSSK